MAAERNPVVLLHGIDDTCKLFDRLRPFLEKRGWVVYCFNLIPNNGDVGLEVLAEQLDAYAERTFGGEQPFDLVGYSMGGLVARYYVQHLGGLKRVQRLITISTPHRGSWMAYLRGNAGARQMRPGSYFLRKSNRETEALQRVAFTSIWTPLDLMILPANSAVIPEARSIPVLVIAHPLMMSDWRVLRLVQAALIAGERIGNPAL